MLKFLLIWLGIRWLLKLLAKILLIIFLAVQGWYFAWVIHWKYSNPGQTSFMTIQLSELHEKNPKATLNYRWTPYERIAYSLKQAAVSAEDARFTEHHGFDWQALQKAADRGLRKGVWKRGGSTITQQLAKNLFLSGARSFLRKIQEAIITVMIELLWEKRRILEVYLNIAQWSPKDFGAEAAARHYFKVSAAQLSPDQSATLAALLPAPERYGRNIESDYLNRRSAQILEDMPYAQVPR